MVGEYLLLLLFEKHILYWRHAQHSINPIIGFENFH